MKIKIKKLIRLFKTFSGSILKSGMNASNKGRAEKRKISEITESAPSLFDDTIQKTLKQLKVMMNIDKKSDFLEKWRCDDYEKFSIMPQWMAKLLEKKLYIHK